MPAGPTYETIATTTLTSPQTSITFSSISGSYTDLVLVSLATCTGDASTGDVNLQFNGDTGSNYSVTGYYGIGSSGTTYRQTNKNFLKWTYGATNLRPIVRAHIMNYSNTTTNKTVLFRDDLTSNATETRVGLWRNTAAITSIAITIPGTTFTSDSIFSLYGIAAA
jgi:hypothetical protein